MDAQSPLRSLVRELLFMLYLTITVMRELQPNPLLLPLLVGLLVAQRLMDRKK